MNKVLGICCLLVSLATARAEQIVLQGKWYNDDYQIAMSTEWEDIQGTWGDTRYKLVWDSQWQKLEGKTAGVKQEFEVDPSAGMILGDSYLGWIDLRYVKAPILKITGNLWQKPVNLEFANEAMARDWIHSQILREFVSEFPEPTREPVFEFLKRIVQPEF